MCDSSKSHHFLIGWGKGLNFLIDTAGELFHIPGSFPIRGRGGGIVDETKKLLDYEHFDMAILDIMGVEGFELLEIAREKEVIAVMLTAHALSP